MYFNAVYIAKCYANEPGADRVRAVAHDAEGLASCELGRLDSCAPFTASCARGT